MKISVTTPWDLSQDLGTFDHTLGPWDFLRRPWDFCLGLFFEKFRTDFLKMQGKVALYDGKIRKKCPKMTKKGYQNLQPRTKGF